MRAAACHGCLPRLPATACPGMTVDGSAARTVYCRNITHPLIAANKAMMRDTPGGAGCAWSGEGEGRPRLDGDSGEEENQDTLAMSSYAGCGESVQPSPSLLPQVGISYPTQEASSSEALICKQRTGPSNRSFSLHRFQWRLGCQRQLPAHGPHSVRRQ